MNSNRLLEGVITSHENLSVDFVAKNDHKFYFWFEYTYFIILIIRLNKNLNIQIFKWKDTK